MNSWLKNSFIARAGPHTLHSGGGAQLLLKGAARWNLRPTMACERTVYRAHATEVASGDANAWVGGSTSLLLGLEFAP